MDISFDPTKDAWNRAKHGVSLALAADIEWDTALVWTDTREDYGEERQCALVLYGVRLYFVAFVDREDGRRIISLRKATNQEQARYVRDVFDDP
ncbi:BrnT family toxin [Imhoffiella purpurea]|uniref:BrnT family toxin n=1 Tax=Imhoffiella purpurea TaxID=1249627 RepID=UPI0005C1467A|nr:BrnT family toxin [Imhoffiella purpurea]